MTVQRKALLIASEFGGELQGVYKDINSLKSFMLSNIGGAWREDEIITLENPNYEETMQAIKGFDGIDYSFAFYAGHGFHAEGRQDFKNTLTCIPMNKSNSFGDTFSKRGFKITADTLAPEGVTKCTVILDSCRGLEDYKLPSKTVVAMESFRLDNSKEWYREKFDQLIEKAETGEVIIFSCNLGESAGENPEKGGIFTTALISNASSGSVPLTLDMVFNNAKEDVKKASKSRQNPVMYGGRRLHYFPFAIH